MNVFELARLPLPDLQGLYLSLFDSWERRPVQLTIPTARREQLVDRILERGELLAEVPRPRYDCRECGGVGSSRTHRPDCRLFGLTAVQQVLAEATGLPLGRAR
jgi:hypothetical protein